MTITRKLTSITTAAALAFTALAPAANAGGYKGDRGYDRGYSQNQKFNAYGNGYGKGYGYNKGGRDRDYAYRHHHKRDNKGKYIALGIGALMLGIIASGASRH